jgi:nicotinamide-nucleotide amidase
LPYLQEKMGDAKVIKALILKTAGIGESSLDEKIADLMTSSNPTVGLAAHTGQTDIRITVRADNDKEADGLIAEMEARVRERAGGYIYATGQTPLQNALVGMLRKQGKTLGISETGTSQTLHERLKAVPGGVEVLAHVAYHENTDAMRSSMTNVDAEADLEALTKAEAANILQNDKVDVAIAVSTDDHGTCIAVVTPTKSRSRVYNFGGDETRAPIWAGTWGMSFAWRLLKEHEEDAE